MLSYSLASVPDGGYSVNQLRRQIRKANPAFFVMNVSRLMDRRGPTTTVSIDLRLKSNNGGVHPRSVIVNGNKHMAKPLWINRRESVFDMRSILHALPQEALKSRKKTRLS